MVTNIDLESLTAVADRFRALVRTSSLTDTPSPISVTVSAGATLANLEDDPESILQRVDRLLYRSKEEGRDRTSVEQPG